MEDGERSERGSSSPADSRRGSQAAPMDASEEPRGQEAPNSEVCVSSCRHCFCFPCIQEWARRKSVCPRCQRPVNHIFPLRDGRIHEGRDEGRGSDGSRRCPSGRRNDGSSSRARARGRGGGSARGRSGSRRWHRNSRRWSRRGRRSKLRSRRRLWSTAWGTDHSVGRGPPPERAVVGNATGRRRQQPGMRRRRRGGQGRGQRRRNWYEQHVLPPRLHAPSSPRRGERGQRRGPSRSGGAARSRSQRGQRSRARRGTV